MKTQTNKPKTIRGKKISAPVNVTITVKRRKITPTIAAEMLSRNKSNRKLNQQIVQRYARTMTAGGWMLNAETIKFDRSADLFDGQHRLQACVLSGKPFEAFVAEGIEREAFDTVDIGKGRTSADALYASGSITNAPLMASIANLAIKMETASLKLNRYIEPHRVREWVSANMPEVAAAADRVRKMNFLGFSPVLGLVYLIAKRKDSDKADEFFMQLETGENLSKGDPALTLRETLVKHKSDRGYHKADVLSMAFAAWNAFQMSKELSVLKRNMGQGIIESLAVEKLVDAYAA